MVDDVRTGARPKSAVPDRIFAALGDPIRCALVARLAAGRFFGSEDLHGVMLDNPRVIECDRVTHLLYKVRRDVPIVVHSNAELQASVDQSPHTDCTRP